MLFYRITLVVYSCIYLKIDVLNKLSILLEDLLSFFYNGYIFFIKIQNVLSYVSKVAYTTVMLHNGI